MSFLDVTKHCLVWPISTFPDQTQNQIIMLITIKELRHVNHRICLLLNHLMISVEKFSNRSIWLHFSNQKLYESQAILRLQLKNEIEEAS